MSDQSKASEYKSDGRQWELLTGDVIERVEEGLFLYPGWGEAQIIETSDDVVRVKIKFRDMPETATLTLRLDEYDESYASGEWAKTLEGTTGFERPQA